MFFLGADPSRRAVWTAAVARCGPEARRSHASAAALWQLTGDEGRPHVTVPRGRTSRVRGIHVHWTTRPMLPARRHGIPVTTLDDFARNATDHAVKRALRQAEYHHALDLALLAGEARSARRHPHAAARPALQPRTPGGRADFVWHGLGLVAEVDGYDAHRGRIAFREDRLRDRRNLRAGLTTLRFTWEDVQLTPATVADDLVSAASSRSTVSSTWS